MDKSVKSSRKPTMLRRAVYLLKRAKHQQSLEFEQLLIRYVIFMFCTGYVLTMGISFAELTDDEISSSFLVSLFGNTFNTILFIHLLLRPLKTHLRRVVGLIVDVVSLTLFIKFGAEVASPFVAIYIWITMGYGFRFGVKYLFSATTLCVLAFSYIIATTHFWQQYFALSVGLLMSQVILPFYFATLIKKLTEAKAQAEQANAAKSQFLATMSHELRTPLNAIIGFSDVLRSSKLSGDQRQMVRSVGSAAGALLHLMNGLLDFARIESGKVSKVSEPVDLHKLLASIESIILAQAKHKGLGLSFSLSPYVPPLAVGDFQHLQEILINLCANAVKFTERGFISVHLDLQPAATGNGQNIRFSVTDTGVGIPKSQQEHIFESFTQAKETRKSSHGGAGLGLAICKHLVELMGGEIGVESTPGQGSMFYFTVPHQKTASAGQGDQLVFAPDQIFYISNQVEDRITNRIAGLGLDTFIISDVGKAVRTVIEKVADNGLRPVVVIDCRDPAVDISLLANQFAQERLLFDPVLIAVADAADADMKRFLDLECLLAVLTDNDTDQALRNIFRMASALVSEQAADLEGRAENSRHSRSLNILVAEDNRVNRMVAAKILEHVGHKVFLVENGEQALDALDHDEFDLVFMDINMPVIDGLEATQLYRYSHPDEPHLPIVALTADATEEGKRRCYEAGMDKVIHKPVTTDMFLDVIEALVPQIERRDREGLADTGAAAGNAVNVETHPRFQNAKAAILDPEKLKELRTLGEGSDFFETLMRDFAEDARILSDELEKSVNGRDVPAFRDANHALRSAAANIGALRIFNLCDKTGGMKREEIPVKGPQFIAALKEELLLVTKEISDLHHEPPLELDPIA